MRGSWRGTTFAAVAALLVTAVWTLAQDAEPPDEGRSSWRVPGGVYTGIVVAVRPQPGTPSRLATLETREGSFGIAVPAGSTFILPFAGGWRLGDNDARVRVEGGASGVEVFGLTAAGPVAFR